MEDMSALLHDPRIFNFVLVAIYAANAARWAIHGSWPDTLYWVGALIITIALTWGYSR
jgi:hypothetical protein